MNKLGISFAVLFLLTSCELFDSGSSTYSTYSGNSHDNSIEQAQNAIKSDDAEKLAQLLRSGDLSIYTRLPGGESLLEAAIKHKAEKSSKILIEKTGYVTERDLEKACDQGLYKLAQVMIEKKSAYVSTEFITRVAKSGNIDFFQWLVDRFVKQDYRFSKSYMSDYVTAASKAGYFGVVKILLEKGAELTTTDIENLMKHHADIQISDTMFIDLVKKATEAGQANQVKILFQLPHNLSQAQLNECYPRWPLFSMEDALIELMQHGIKVSAEQCQNAYEAHMHTLVQKMIETKSVDVNEAYFYKTMLYFAVEKEDAGLVELLLKHGAGKSIHTDYFGTSPIDKRILVLKSIRPTDDRILNSLCLYGATSKSAEYTCSSGWKKKKEEQHSGGKGYWDNYWQKSKDDYVPPPPEPEAGVKLETCIEFYSEVPVFKAAWVSNNKEKRTRAIKKAFKSLTRKHHSDIGGSTEKMQEVNLCKEKLMESL